MIEARSSAPPDPSFLPSASIGLLANGSGTENTAEGDGKGGAEVAMEVSSLQQINDVRQTRSSSPAVRRTGRTTSGSSGRRRDESEGGMRQTDLDRNPFNVSEEEASLERQELQQLKTRASTSSSAILPPAPTLPYDVSYPPLSPLGVDQVGHPLASRFPLQAAQLSSAAAAAAGGAGGKVNGGGSGFAQHTASHTGGGRHSTHDKPKKPLPGQELEHHLLSDPEITSFGVKPMPWGLRTALIDRARDAPRNRTRMGTLKRTAPRHAKSTQIDFLRAEDSQVQSKDSTPQLEMIEMEASAADELGHDQTAAGVPAIQEMEADVEVVVDDSVEQLAGATGNGTEPFVTNGESEEKSIESPEVEARPGDVSTSSLPQSQTQSAKKRRRKASTNELQALLQINGALSEADAADTTAESVNSSTRRPREAHKRLKMMGGYYGRNPRVSLDATADVIVDAEETEVNGLEPGAVEANGHSRATSSIPDADVGALSAAEEPDIVDVSLAPTTPIKSSQQPSLSMGLRQSSAKSQSGKMVHAGSGLIDNGEGNNEFCDTCKGIGHFICCDGCPRSFHFACINPPLDIDELPVTVGDAEDKWYCNVCKAEKLGKAGGKTRDKKALAPLVTYIDSVNPTIFSLPHDIRNHFKGVATATDGSYVDATMMRPLKIGKFGLIDERDPYKLKEKNGRTVLCYRCGKSALPTETSAPSKSVGARRSSPRKSVVEASPVADGQADSDRKGWRKVLGCDFCALHWHLDCLEPPMATMPSLHRKWMCPNHVDHAVRLERVPKSVANSTSIHDLPVPSEKSVGPGKHYRTRVVNDGLIDIIPDPLDTYFGSSASSTGVSKTEKASNLAAISGATSDNRGRGLDKGWEEQDIPSIALSTLSSAAFKPHAPSTSASSNLKFKYRVPEKVIRLDFWNRAEMERERSLSRFLHRIERQSRFKLDTLAGIANAALATFGQGGTSVKIEEESASDADVRPTEEEAKALAERLFGSQTMRTLYPDLRSNVNVNGGSTDDQGDSSVRQTFVEGEYEEEFDARAASAHISANKDLDAVVDVATMTAPSAESKSARDESLASQLDIGAVEMNQLRAVRALLQRRGPRVVLDFLMEDNEAPALTD